MSTAREFTRLVTAVGLGAFGLAAQAAPVLCDMDAPNGKNYMSVDSAQVSACLDAGTGNIGNGPNDDFLEGLAGAGFAEIGDTGDDSDFGLTAGAGTWGFDASAWSSYADLAIGFKFGTGNTADEWFVYSLVDGVSSGGWTFFDVIAPGNSDDRLSHVVLYGRGTREVPEPSTLALLGLGLLGVGALRRRRAR